MLKRALDAGVAAVALVLLSPVLLLVAVWIKLDSPGPVFFRQERVGLNGRPFRIFKFRTMAAVQPAGGLQITSSQDARITRAGTFLRGTKLDELPQLIDVLRGTMSLVGPRPEVPHYVEHYPAEHRERVLSVRPGITDFASVHYRRESELLARAADPEREYLDVILPSKLRYAMHYVDNVSVADDLRVLGLTLRTVFVPTFPTSRRWLAMNDSKLWGRLDRAMSSLHPRRNLFAMLEAIARSHELTKTQRDKIETSYASTGAHLAEDRKFGRYVKQVHPQGSFVLGTMVRHPEFDIDSVARLEREAERLYLGAAGATQLLNDLHASLSDYGARHHLKVTRKKRCVQIEYAQGMHADITPVYLVVIYVHTPAVLPRVTFCI